MTKLAVNTREGEVLELTLNDDSRGIVVRPASLDDIKQGDYSGLTSVASDGKRVAISVHIFADDLRGTAEGHVPWDLVKEPNTMAQTGHLHVIEQRLAQDEAVRLVGLDFGVGQFHAHDLSPAPPWEASASPSFRSDDSAMR